MEKLAFIRNTRIRVLRVELLNVHVWQKTLAAFASDDENLHARALLRQLLIPTESPISVPKFQKILGIDDFVEIPFCLHLL